MPEYLLEASNVKAGIGIVDHGSHLPSINTDGSVHRRHDTCRKESIHQMSLPRCWRALNLKKVSSSQGRVGRRGSTILYTVCIERGDLGRSQRRSCRDLCQGDKQLQGRWSKSLSDASEVRNWIEIRHHGHNARLWQSNRTVRLTEVRAEFVQLQDRPCNTMNNVLSGRERAYHRCGTVLKRRRRKQGAQD